MTRNIIINATIRGARFAACLGRNLFHVVFRGLRAVIYSLALVADSLAPG